MKPDTYQEGKSNQYFLNFSIFGRWSLVTGLLSLVLFSGCIRLHGSAGYYKKGPEDESPQVHQVGFDTQKRVPGHTPGSITVDEDV